MAYENITIGTEQELSNTCLAIKNEDGSAVSLDMENKIVLSIYNADATEKLVDVTADTRVGKENDFYLFQLEFRTTKAGNEDTEAWEQRKEAIKLFVQQIILEPDEEEKQKTKEYKASEFVVTLSASSPESEHQYICKGDEDDSRSFYFIHEGSAKYIHFSSHLTIGIEYKNLVKEFQNNALNDSKGWNMVWLKDCSEELWEPLGVINVTEEEKFFYSYICSVFDYSVYVYISMHPDDVGFSTRDRNASKEKNKWHVLPRSEVSRLLRYFKQEKGNVYTYFRNRRYQDGAAPDKIKENKIYEEMAAAFWKEYDAGHFDDADLLLRAGTIDNTGDQFLFEYRSVLNNIPNVYDDSGMYIYRPVQKQG